MGTVTAFLIKFRLPDPEFAERSCSYPRVILCKHTCVCVALLNRMLNVLNFMQDAANENLIYGHPLCLVLVTGRS